MASGAGHDAMHPQQTVASARGETAVATIRRMKVEFDRFVRSA
jgi:hypothetical protein